MKILGVFCFFCWIPCRVSLGLWLQIYLFMSYCMYRREKKWIKPWWIIILILLLIGIWFLVSRVFGTFTVNTEVAVKAWDTFGVFYSGLSDVQVARIKRYIKKNDIDMSRLEVGSYTFSGQYNPGTFVATVLDGSEKDFMRVTILEGWSIYDIDDYLTKQWWIEKGKYIAYTTDPETIIGLQSNYAFLQEAGTIGSLEGFLYPETYFLDKDADIVSSLVRVQLDTFGSKVWDVLSSDIAAFSTRLAGDFPRVQFSWYDIVRLASVIQKEERIAANQPTIAGLFLRRLQIGMRLDADITLCYGLKQPYAVCTPSYIARYVSDKTNVYNTRQQWGMPPTAIANVPVSAIQAVLNYVISDYLYYLHDADGRIYYGSTLEEHNQNKQLYLR